MGRDDDRDESATSGRWPKRAVPATTLRRAGAIGLGVVGGLLLIADPVVASGETTRSSGTFHVVLELLQLVGGTIVVGIATLSVKTMRGGRMEEAFYSLTAGIVVFLVQRVLHTGHEFGLLFALPRSVDQLLYLVAITLMGVGFLQVYRIMQPTQ